MLRYHYNYPITNETQKRGLTMRQEEAFEFLCRLAQGIASMCRWLFYIFNFIWSRFDIDKSEIVNVYKTEHVSINIKGKDGIISCSKFAKWHLFGNVT